MDFTRKNCENCEKTYIYYSDQCECYECRKIIKKDINKDSDTLKQNFINTFYNFNNRNEFLLLIRKGVFHYDYMDSLERLKEQNLPAKKLFYSSLSASNISDDDYQHAKRVFKKFKCKNIEDYNNIYVKSDVLLLDNIFTSHRLRSYETYGIDPACCISAPG